MLLLFGYILLNAHLYVVVPNGIILLLLGYIFHTLLDYLLVPQLFWRFITPFNLLNRYVVTSFFTKWYLADAIVVRAIRWVWIHWVGDCRKIEVLRVQICRCFKGRLADSSQLLGNSSILGLRLAVHRLVYVLIPVICLKICTCDLRCACRLCNQAWFIGKLVIAWTDSWLVHHLADALVLLESD